MITWQSNNLGLNYINGALNWTFDSGILADGTAYHTVQYKIGTLEVGFSNGTYSRYELDFNIVYDILYGWSFGSYSQKDYQNHTFQVETSPIFRVLFTNGSDTLYLEPNSTQIINSDGSQTFTENANTWEINDLFNQLTWINAEDRINQTQWKDNNCAYTEVSYLNGTNMTSFAQCYNGTTRYYPGESDPLVLYKETGVRYGHLSIYYANGTVEVLEQSYTYVNENGYFQNSLKTV